MLKHWIWNARLACLSAAALLAACGGGNSTTASTAAGQAPVLRVEGRSAPTSQTADVSAIKSRDAALAPKPSTVRLGALDTSKEAAMNGWGPRKVGAARDVAATSTVEAFQRQLNWQRTPQGGHVAAISFGAEGAHGLRLGVQVQALPNGTVLRVYSQERPGTVYQISGQEVLQRIQRNVESGDTTVQARTWWTPDTGTGETTLEIELPPGVPTNALQVAIAQVSHFFESLEIPTEREMSEAKINESATCNLDSTCNDAYANQRNAVARMIYTANGSSYLCSGTLINDAGGTGTPYFLSANHCISTQTVASTLQTDWFYRSPTCNSRTLSSATVARRGGADLLYASASTDTALLRLKETPPSGVFYAGWDANADASPAGTAVTGIHHPRGDLQKISFGSLQGQASCTAVNASQFSCSGTTGNYYRVAWTQGTTEGGSSGSALFTNGGAYVVGTLYGGSATCSTAGAQDFYGRFDVAFNAGLRQWLANGGAPSGRVPVYRFYNRLGAEHFYTASTADRDLLINQYSADFSYEGPVFYAYPSETQGMFPVFRMVDAARKIHLYTASADERDAWIRAFNAYSEGTGWWSQAQTSNDTKPVYRFFNRQTGTYFYSVNSFERDYVNTHMKDQYTEEGIAFYVWPNQ